MGRALPTFDQPGLWPTPEQTLVLRGAVGNGDEAVAAFNTWRAGVDLEGHFDYQVFRLLPLLYSNLLRLGVTDPLMHRLKGTYRLQWARSQRLFRRMRPVVEAFARTGMPVMLLKGAPLALAYYRNAALRPMADIDLMVKPADLTRAFGLARECGFTPLLADTPDVRRFRHAVLFRDSENREFDLHWHALHELCDDDADEVFWANTREVDFDGVPFLIPDATRMLVHTVIHGVRFNSEPPIRWIADAVTILRVEEGRIDWDAVVEFARQHRISRRMWLGLTYLARIMGLPVPESVLVRLARTRVAFVERVEGRSLLRDQVRLNSNALGGLWLLFAEYCRFGRGQMPLAFAVGLSHFIRYSWRLDGRRRLPGIILRGVAKRIVPRRASIPTPTAGQAARQGTAEENA